MTPSVNRSPGAAPAASPAPQVASAAEGEQRFLKLLVTQLSNQDPLNPLDNAQLTSQLAQMSTVSGIEKLNAAFSSLLAQSASSQVLQSASLIGRSVLVPGDRIDLSAGPAAPLQVELPQGAQKLELAVVDARGGVVRRLAAEGLGAGTHALAWDGRSSTGSPLPPGRYRVEVQALGAEDAPLPATALVASRVASVAQAGTAGASLGLEGGQRVALSDVRRVD